MNHAIFVAESARFLARTCNSRIGRLSQEGFTVHVVAGDDGGFEHLPGDTLARPIPTKLAALPAAFVLLQAYLIEHEPLLVHGIGMPWAALSALAAHRVGTPAVFSTVEQHLVGGDAPWPDLAGLLRSFGVPLDDVARSVYRRVAQWSDRYVTTTVEDLEIAEEWTPGQKLDLAVGGRGADVANLNPHASNLTPVGELRGAIKPAGRRNWVGATVDEEGLAGIRDLAKLAKMLEIERPDATFLLGIDPLCSEQVHRQVKGIDAPWTLHNVDQSLDFMRSLDLYLMTPTADPFGVGAMTASTCAIPVAALDCRQAREVVVHDSTGIIASLDDYLSQVCRLLDDPGRLRRMGVRARTRAVERFDRRQVDDQMLRLYDNVLRGKLT